MGPFSVTGQPNAMGGREVGGLANTLAAHMEIENPEHRRDRPGFLGLARDRLEAGPEGGRPVPRRRGRPGQGALDHGNQPGRQHAGGRSGARGDPQLPVRRRLRRLPLNRHDGARRRAAAAPRPGARRTARSPIPSGACRASGRSSRRRARRCRTGGRSREVATPHGLRRRLRLSFAGRDFRRIRAPHRDRRTTAARDLDLGALADISETRLRRAGAVPMAAPRGRGAGRDALLRRRPLLPRRRQGALRRHALPRARPLRPARAFRSSSTPAASATSGTR